LWVGGNVGKQSRGGFPEEEMDKFKGSLESIDGILLLLQQPPPAPLPILMAIYFMVDEWQH
jgi:hypothetical protein